MRSERLAAASGAVYVLAILIGNGLYEAGKSGAEDGPGVLADLQRTTSPVQTVGLTLEILGFAAFLVFLGALYRILRRGERADGWLAATALGAGLVTVAVKLGSIGPLMGANRRSGELTPDLARTLNDLGAADFVTSGYTSGIFVAAAGAATLTTRALPGWLAITGVVVGVLTIAAGTAGIVDPAGYVPVPFLLGLLWIFVASAILAVRGPAAADDGARSRAAEPVPAGGAGPA
jgi:predicted nucleic acid-binding protein